VTESPKEKPLRIVAFAIHGARGLIRDQTMRRKTMFVVLIAALVMLFTGSTFLQGLLSPHDHPFWFATYWLACGWLTFAAMLLALLDLLKVRIEARKVRKALRAQVAADRNSDPSISTPGE
jgi:hypothetical protein